MTPSQGPSPADPFFHSQGPTSERWIPPAPLLHGNTHRKRIGAAPSSSRLLKNSRGRDCQIKILCCRLSGPFTGHSVRSERLLTERLEYNLVFRRFVGWGWMGRSGTRRCFRRSAIKSSTASGGPVFLPRWWPRPGAGTQRGLVSLPLPARPAPVLAADDAHLHARNSHHLSACLAIPANLKLTVAQMEVQQQRQR